MDYRNFLVEMYFLSISHVSGSKQNRNTNKINVTIDFIRKIN